MFIKKILKSTLVLIAVSLLLSACGGGDDNTPPDRHTGSLSGNVFDAPVNGAQIEVYEFKSGKLGRKLASTTSNAFGDYKVEFKSSSIPLLVVAKEGSYTDPLTNEIVSVSNGKMLRLESVINYREGSDQRLMLTPLTNIASALTKYKIEQGASDGDAISEALTIIDSMYGFNVNETTPIDITKGGQSTFATPGHFYGALLTAYSSFSYDLIKKYGDTDANIYTSMHLADIQYRDVIADGLLDGKEISEVTGAVTPLTFGQQKVTSDVYTNVLSQHVLIVVNNPNLNVSGTKAEDYVEFSQQLNALGTGSGGDGVIPPRDEIEIDTTPPAATRTDKDVLAGTDTVDISVSDEIGVQGVSAYIEYKLNGYWSNEFQCDDLTSSGSEFCTIEFNDFEVGVRESHIQIVVDTNAIDKVDIDPKTGISNVTDARLVLYTEDVLGNKLIQGRDKGHYINFNWDNNAPVIDVTSSSAINNSVQEYVIKGIVKEDSQEIKSVSVSFKSGLPEALTCSPVIVESGSACEFSKVYLTTDFLSTTTFHIKATDSKNNVGAFLHSVSRDDQEPAQIITYPDGTMSFVKVGLDGERTAYDGVFTQDVYTSENVQSSRDYLKINYLYASAGIQNTIKDVDFKNFNVNLLKENKIPYVRVKVSDINSDTVLGSSADKLKLVVKYYVSQNNDNNYAFRTTTETVASTDKYTAKIPHETILDNNGRVDEVIYYVPFVKEILGDSFKSVSENSSQKLVIQTIDESENESAVQEVYFRSSFDLPTMTVVTPFIGARVQLEGLNQNGEFTSLASCTTIQKQEGSSTNIALDVAGCETTTDVVNYEFMRVRLIGVEGTQPHYYQWKTDANARANVNLNNANIGAYFKLNGSKIYSVTELSTYQTGLFDYKWNSVEAGGKTSARAIQILEDVQHALAGSNNSSFFGFDPTVVSYATNEMLASVPIPENPSNDYLHRFLVEAIGEIVSDMQRSNSVDFASAIYDDFSYDGKANGIGSGGSQIVLDRYTFTSDTYRKELAQAYYDIMTNKYGVAPHIAQLYADDISMANPSLDGEPIFDREGGSIDVLPPQPTLTIESGRETIVGNMRYVAGEVISRITLEDPSGIVEKAGSQPTFNSVWYDKTEPNSARPLEVTIDESSSSTIYRKEYTFTLDTSSTDLPSIIEFAIETSAMDIHGNAYGYNGKDPHIEKVHVDNDYPVVAYVPPNDVNGDPIGEEVYLNAKNNIHELTFKISDVVGDKLDKRGLLFYKPTGEVRPFTYEQFSSNSKDNFKVKLCSGENCAAQGNTIYPGDGNWLVVASAEDNLGNSVSRIDSTAPRFNINIDSEAPVVNGAIIEKRLGGNDIWTPVVDWGDLSKGSHVKVDLRRGSGQSVTLASCNPEADVCNQPYLIGSQPDVKVQLVADAFDYNVSNEFYVTATDTAYPANVSVTGVFTFKVDNKGPEIVLNTPWIEDSISKESYVVGREFDVRFKSVVDDSSISEVALFQEGSLEPIKSIKPTDPTKEFVMSITKADSDKIDVSDEQKAISLFVKAKDVYGFESSSNSNSIILDREGPTLGLSGFSADNYYLGNYVFNLTALDLNSKGDTSVEGVNRESLEFWTFTDTEPLPGTPGTKIDKDQLQVALGGLSTGVHNVRLKGSDVRGNTTLTSGDNDFRVKVYNSIPQVSLTMKYQTTGEEITDVIYQGGNIVLSLNIVDESGVDRIYSSYKFAGDANGTNFTFVEQSDGTWQAVLSQTQIASDGNYEFEIRVYNNVRYLKEEDRQVGVVKRPFSVQRNGVELAVSNPTNFQNYISNGTLEVSFSTLSAVKASKIQCWVRQEYSSEVAPDPNEKPTSGEKNISPGQDPTCSVDSEGLSFLPSVLIVKTVGSNGAESVQKFDFRMMDAALPTVIVPESDTYQFAGGEITYNQNEPTKYLAFDLKFRDELSGVNISNADAYPKLVRKSGGIIFDAESCMLNAKGETVCRYKHKYSDIIQSTAFTHDYIITNVKDNAGNLAADHDFQFLLPTDKPQVIIESPTDNAVINAQRLVVNFKVRLNENSKLENVTANFGSESYNLKDNENNFTKFVPCSGSEGFNCSTFTSDILGEDVDGKVMTVSIVATDVWDNSGQDSVESIRFDNTPPNIGEEVLVTESPDSQDKVRFTFDITDTGSGLDKVKYTVLNPSYQEEKTADVNYFELDKSSLQGLSTITIDIKATDKVGLSTDARKVINIGAPTIKVEFDSITGLQGGKLLLTSPNQLFTISSVDGEVAKASRYTLDLIPNTGEALSYSGNILASIGSNTMNFSIEDQATYTLKVTVIDSIGRSIANFELFGRNYDERGVESVVDYEEPIISSVVANQVSMVPTNNQYQVDVTAYVTDRTLNLVTSTADSGNSTYSPHSITKPDTVSEPYIMHYWLPAGNYTVKVAASDLANHKTERSIQTQVDAATTPELTISRVSNEVLAGGEEIELTFSFTEQAVGFEFSDVSLIASDGGNAGILKQETWSTEDNLTWKVNFVSPERENKNITIRVEDGSYQSINTIPGKGDSLLLGVEGMLPTLSNATFTPTHQLEGQSVAITLEFDKELQAASAELGGSAVTLTKTADAKVWT
ncbi:hypothetical protein, partial [Vibrio vulnificus]